MDDSQIQSILQKGSAGSIGVALGVAAVTFGTEGAVDWRAVWTVFFITALPWAIYATLGQKGYVD